MVTCQRTIYVSILVPCSDLLTSGEGAVFSHAQRLIKEFVMYVTHACCLLEINVSTNKNEPGHEKTHPRSLTSAFVFRCSDSIISLDSIAEISRL